MPSRSASAASARREPRQSGPTRTSAASRSPALRECFDQQVQSLLPRIQSADEHEHPPVAKPGCSAYSASGRDARTLAVRRKTIRHDDDRAIHSVRRMTSVSCGLSAWMNRASFR